MNIIWGWLRFVHRHLVNKRGTKEEKRERERRKRT